MRGERLGYDYVIVGGGSAGCALAARLTEIPGAGVLLLEAGPTDNNPYIHMPVGFAKMTAGRSPGATDRPQRHADDREITFAQARVIGGGSSINAEVFTRGCPQDYDRWANEEGCPGWSFAEVKPYFLRSEDNDTFAGRGPRGRRAARRLDPHAQPDDQGVRPGLSAGRHPLQSRFQRRPAGGLRRLSDDHAQRPALLGGGRLPPAGAVAPEPAVRTDCLTTRIVVENGRAIGVEVARGRDRDGACRERGDRRRRRDRLAEAPDALRHRPGRRAAGARHRAGPRPARRRPATSRTITTSTSSTS